MSFPLSYKFVSLLTRPYLKKIKGLENLPENPPFIIASNHHSNFDSVIIASSLGKYLKKRIHYLASPHPLSSKNFFYKALAKFILIKWSQCILTEKNGTEEGTKALKQGKIIGIFPQGRVVFGGKEYLSGLRTGVAVMSTKAKVPVVPVKLSDASHLWLSSKKFPKLWKFKSINVTVGKPISFQDYYGKSLEKNDFLEITENIVGQIDKLEV